MERLILVNEDDEEIGSGEKLEVHREGKLHRAFSIFVFDSAGRLLLQKRAESKYHSGGLWTNTCCGHPRPGESVAAAAHRRLREEMNFDCELRPCARFIYRAEVGGGLTEWEYDHVLAGVYDDDPRPNEAEAAGWRWADLDELKTRLAESPGSFTYWFRFAASNFDLAAFGEQARKPVLNWRT